MSWKKYVLGDILKRKRTPEKIDSEKEYKLVTIKLYHKGVIPRSIVKGATIKSPMSSVKSGDFVLSGIDARNGAFGIVPKELDGAVITNDFWCIEPDETKISKDFFLYITSTAFFDYICKQSSDGTTQRIRLQKDRFFNYEIALPSIEEQKEILKQLNNLSYIKGSLTSELTHQLDLVKQLRQSFLREAMQGKLVKSTNTKETGQQLLKKIKAEKAQLIAEKKIKKEKPLPLIIEEEIPFETPEHWAWCRLNEICDYIIDCPHSTPQYTDMETEYFGIDTNCINDKGEITRLRGLSRESYLDRIKRLIPKENDIVYAREGSIGLATFIPSDKNICLGQRVMLFRASNIIKPKYLKFVVTDDEYKKRLLEKHRGIGAKHVNVSDIKSSLIPLPPLHEQEQIVAKLEELMGFCDGLEQSIKESQGYNKILLQQVLREALQGEEV
ncbi:restriction endonuclease subunit S [Flavobacterium ovatum]|uniref:restriction endonuclease subunit S n=1 Tax=Flavobacterium ovatum TaxID=1928857 RepID=UPI00344FFDB6